MKTAIYIEDGVVQLVLTPETKFETGALESFGQKPMTAVVKIGSFYDCVGGYTRHSTDNDKCSLILRHEITPATPA